MTPEESRQMSQLVQLVDAMDRRLTALQESTIARELWMDNDGDIWHHENGRMYPLNDEGEHIDVRNLRHRARRVGPVLGMQKDESFPTLGQVQDLMAGQLARCTELDVVKRHVRKLEARLSELEG